MILSTIKKREKTRSVDNFSLAQWEKSKRLCLKVKQVAHRDKDGKKVKKIQRAPRLM